MATAEYADLANSLPQSPGVLPPFNKTDYAQPDARCDLAHSAGYDPYDGLNRRTSKLFNPATSLGNQYYYNQGWQVIVDRYKYATLQPAWNDEYIYGPGGSDVPMVWLHDGNDDGDVSDSYSTDWRGYYTTDALGSVTGSFRFDESNTLVATTRNVYTAYGEATRSGPDANFDGPLYAGYFFDAQTGLYQVRNRYYDPNLSNFISRDPIGYDAGDPNLYRYVANGPIGATDAMGLQRGRPAVVADLAPGRAHDVVIAKHVLEIIEEMKAEKWKPSNPRHAGAFGVEFERRLSAKLAADGPRGTNYFYSDVRVRKSTGRVLAIGQGAAPKDTVQIDLVYYRGKLQVGDTLDKSRIIDVYDAKTGRVDTPQMGKVRRVAGKRVKIIPALEKWTTGGGWRAVESVQKKLKFFQRLGAGFTVFALVTTDIEAREIDHLISERERAGNDLTEIQVWANVDLRPFVDKFIQESAATYLVVQYYISQEKARLEK